MPDQSKDKVKISIALKNFGPLSDPVINHRGNGAVFGIFAGNGSGKTFISRAFQLLNSDELGKSEIEIDDLIADGKDVASLKFSISKGREEEDSISPQVDELILTRKKGIQRVSRSKYIFHVFNSDYVRDNLEAKKYSPDGKIDGYIVGSGNVKLEGERTHLSELKEQLDDIEEKVGKSVDTAKQELIKLGVGHKLAEYTRISTERIIKDDIIFDQDSPNRFQEFKRESGSLQLIKNESPEVAIHVRFPDFPQFVNDLSEIISTSYDRYSLSEQFIKSVENKRVFIEEGLKFIGDDLSKCPFCGQDLKAEALHLIQEYEAFVEQAETKAKNQLLKYKDEIKDWNTKYEKGLADLRRQRNALAQLNNQLPTESRVLITEMPIDSEKVEGIITNLVSAIDEKYMDVSDLSLSIESDIQELLSLCKRSESLLSDVKDCANKVASVYEKLDKVRTSLNRNLCISREAALRWEFDEDIQEYKEVDERIRNLDEQIREEESKLRIEKRSLIAQSFAELVKEFFGERFTFDPESFILSFKNRPIAGRYRTALSDGERSVIGFCYYLAETHLKIDHQDDYSNLFFVVDDPISSMDYSFMFHIAAKLKKPIEEIQRLRLLILTHNSNLQGILYKQHIVENWYCIRKNTVSPIKKGILLPYDEHLREIIAVAELGHEPDYRIPNSIRHVLESIAQFQNPEDSMDSWLKENNLHGTYLYNLIQDLSHGRPRLEVIHSEEEIRMACEDVVTLLENIYPKQLCYARSQ